MPLFPASWKRNRMILPRAERARLLCEVLERRETPAGNVTAVYHAPSATLTLTGSNIGPLDQQVVIDGIGENAVSVRGLDGSGTTINLGAGAVEYFNVKHIVLNMNQGDDEVILNNVQISGNLIFRGGAGNDALIVGDSPGADCSFGSLLFEGGDGDDTLLLHHGNHVIAGELRILGGTGGTFVTLGDQEGDALSVGKLTYLGGSGFDSLEVGGAFFTSAGPVSLSYGNGGSTTILAPTDSLTIEGATSLTAGQGDDSFALGQGGTGNFSLNKLTLNTGAGNSLVVLQGDAYLINGDLTLINLSGNDNVLIEGSEFQLTGKMTYQSSGGFANLAVIPTGSTNIDQGVTFVNSAGDSIISFGDDGAGAFRIGEHFKATLASKSLSVLFQGSSHEIEGNVIISAGPTGADHVFAAAGDSFSVTGKMQLNFGKAANTVVALTSADSVQVGGPVTIVNQAGDDAAIFGDVTTEVSLGELTILNGPGQGVTNFLGTSVTINDKVSVTNGTSAAMDIFQSEAESFSVAGPINISNGIGPSRLLIANAVEGTISGKLSFLSGEGNDEIFLGGLQLNGVNLNVGNGGSLIEFDVDTANIAQLTILGGSGGNEITLLGATDGNVSITTGVDDDLIGISGTVGGNLLINTGNGSDQVNVTFALISGLTSILTGAGDDLVVIAGANFQGNVQIQTGSGDDTVEIAVADVAAESIFANPVVIGVGPGTDTVTIGIEEDNSNRGIFQSSLLLDAGGGVGDSLFIGPPRLNSFAVQPILVGGWATIA